MQTSATVVHPHADQGPDPIDVKVGARVRMRRKFLGMSQSDLAVRLGVSFQQVQKYERGANRISASMLVRTATALDTTVGWLVDEQTADPVADGIYPMLLTSGALELLTAYSKLTSSQSRQAVLTLVRAMIGEAAE